MAESSFQHALRSALTRGTLARDSYMRPPESTQQVIARSLGESGGGMPALGAPALGFAGAAGATLPPEDQPGGGGWVGAIPSSLTPQLLAFLTSQGYRSMNDDNPQGPQGYWAAGTRGTPAFRTGANAPGFELYPTESGGYVVDDWDPNTGGFVGSLRQFVTNYGAAMPDPLRTALAALYAGVR